MIDLYANLRAAIAAGPTPGPWNVLPPRDDYVLSIVGPEHWQSVGRGTGKRNADYIAAANPEVIRALLAERDAMALVLHMLEVAHARLDIR